MIKYLNNTRSLLSVVVLTLGSSITTPLVANYSASVIESDPVVYFQFTESSNPLINSASGSSAVAVSANATNVRVLSTFVYGPRPASGYIGFNANNKAGDFYGTGTGSNVQISGSVENNGGLHGALNGSSGVTVEMWINPSSLPNGSDTGGLFFMPKSNGAVGLSLYLTDSGVSMEGRSQNGGSVSGTNWGFDFNTDSWYHIAGVWSYAEKTMSLYINGEQIGSSFSTIDTWVGDSLSLDNPNHYSSMIGTTRGNDTSYFFKGAIDDFAIYGKALTPAEISAHYAAAIPEASHASLIVGGVVLLGGFLVRRFR